MEEQEPRDCRAPGQGDTCISRLFASTQVYGSVSVSFSCGCVLGDGVLTNVVDTHVHTIA